jgi:pimeloyl-[acyl-carrier protein] methyl ester esterase
MERLYETDMKPMTLVLLPGLDGTEILFDPLLRHLPSWVRPVVVQYPSSGVNTYEELVEIVDRELAPLGEFAMLGWSFGGPLALMIAARRPAQISALVLCASFVLPPLPRLVPYRNFVVTPVFAIVRAFRRIRYVIPGLACGELQRAKAKIWMRVGARVLAARTRAVLQVDVRPQLRECRSPLMYLASTRDEVIPRASFDEVVATAPHAQVAEIAGTHLALYTNPIDSAARITEFLTRSHADVTRPAMAASSAPAPCG